MYGRLRSQPFNRLEKMIDIEWLIDIFSCPQLEGFFLTSSILLGADNDDRGLVKLRVSPQEFAKIIA